MTVNELIEQLKNYSGDMRVLTLGYEGGYNDADLDEESIQMVRDVHPEGYYGDHEVFVEDSYDLRHIDLDTKVIVDGYIIG